MNRRQFLRSIPTAVVAARALGESREAPAPTGPRPNVLMIVLDDQSARLCSAFSRSCVPTPNMERIARRGAWFSHAYSEVPLCCPARTAILTGLHAHHSGVYGNNQAYRRAPGWLAHVSTLPQQFLQAGYLVAGYGKISHHTFQEDEISSYTPGYFKMMDRPRDVTHTDDSLLRYILPGTRTDSWSPHWWPWGVLPDDWDRDDPSKLQQDTEQAGRMAELLRLRHDRPFFGACGFFRPHPSWTVPKRYFDRFPIDRIELPPGFRGDDLEDIPAPGRKIAVNRGEHDFIVRNGLWRRHLQGYYAAISYVDEQIGRVLDALEQGPNRENTIVVFTGDHGWHLGEKNRWSKPTPWELSSHIVCGISGPGIAAGIHATPVGAIDVYPTLLSLCGIARPTTHSLDGVDLAPILHGENRGRGQPVLSTYERGTYSLRDERFRYIWYATGEAELYDHEVDPWEWTNLAGQRGYLDIQRRLAEYLPKSAALPIPHQGGGGEG